MMAAVAEDGKWREVVTLRAGRIPSLWILELEP
ncbi:MAG: hypothetical protein JWO38_926 [Gemmataceae bacterium]|nr:hypothetical protein [Gemmataceae bacterium]